MKLELAPQYKIENGEEVAQFIADHAVLVPLLDEAPPHIDKHFPGSELSLYVYRDTETPEGDDLVVLISTPSKDPYDVARRFDIFLDDWGLQAVHNTDGRLRFNMAFL